MPLIDRWVWNGAFILWLWLMLLSSSVSAQEGRVPTARPVQATQRVDAVGDPLPPAALLRLGTKRFQHPSGPSQIILSLDETKVFSIDDDALIAWDSTDGRQLWRRSMAAERGIRVSAAGYGIQPLAITPDGGRLVTPAGRGRIAFWDVVDGEPEYMNVNMLGTAKSIDVSPDGRMLALGTNRKLLVCDRTGKELFHIENPQQPLARRAINRDRLKFGGDFSYGKFSPDGRMLALVNSTLPHTIQLYEADSGTELRRIEANDRVVRMAFSPDSQRLATTERDIAARLYDVEKGERIWQYVIKPPNAAESYTSAIAFRPDGAQLAVGAPIGADHRIRLVDAKTGNETGSLSGSQWKPWTLQYRCDSHVLYGSGWDGVIRMWNVRTSEQLPPPSGVRASSVCAMSRNRNHLAFADDRQTVHLVDARSGQRLKKFAEDAISWHQVVFSHNGRQLAAGGSSDLHVHVVIWDLNSNAKLHHWSWEKGRDPHSSVEALCFSKDGQRIAAAVFRQDAAYVWDLPSDQQILNVKHNNVYGLDIDAAGTIIITGGWDKTIRVWKCDLGAELKSLVVDDNGRDTRMYGVKFSNDESLIATVDMTHTIRFYDRELNRVSEIEDAGWFTYGALQFSPNDLWIGVGTGRGAEIFDVQLGTKLWAATEHEKYIYTVDFGPLNRTFLSGGSDGVCYLWDLHSAKSVLTSTERADLDKLYQILIGADSRRSFAAYQVLLQMPKRAQDFLSVKLTEATTHQISDTDVRKWIVALGADEQAIVTRATEQLIAWGPAVYEELARIDTTNLTDAKRDRIMFALQMIRRKSRWTIALLADLEAITSHKTLDVLLANAHSAEIKALIRQAVERRGQLMTPDERQLKRPTDDN